MMGTRLRATYRHWHLSGAYTRHQCECQQVQFCDICAPTLSAMSAAGYELCYAGPLHPEGKRGAHGERAQMGLFPYPHNNATLCATLGH